MASRHTPGPWVAYKGGHFLIEGVDTEVPPNIRRYFLDEQGRRVTQFIADCNTFMPEARANAKLIAKAPEMLEFIAKVVASNSDDPLIDLQTEARALLTAIETEGTPSVEED